MAKDHGDVKDPQRGTAVTTAMTLCYRPQMYQWTSVISETFPFLVQFLASS